ncbi:MAG: hypothetical protein H6626_05305 [Pseudobdellovibrionaceae bacterium]|nr:MAG: hypothetical protein H6626_05305 [Pseudobdellovibrionaceae bacterium]
MGIEIKRLDKNNFSDYETVTTLDKEKPCYCSWWHIKPESMEKYDEEKKKNPEKFRNCILSKVENGFHVGVIAYENDDPIAWISVGPIPQFFWAWKRILKLGEKAESTAGIMCFNTFPKHRGQNRTVEILKALSDYGRKLGWSGIEGYPFDKTALEKHGDAVLWPGLTEEFIDSGFERLEDHWLSTPEASRSIYYKSL